MRDFIGVWLDVTPPTREDEKRFFATETHIATLLRKNAKYKNLDAPIWTFLRGMRERLLGEEADISRVKIKIMGPAQGYSFTGEKEGPEFVLAFIQLRKNGSSGTSKKMMIQFALGKNGPKPSLAPFFWPGCSPETPYHMAWELYGEMPKQ